MKEAHEKYRQRVDEFRHDLPYYSEKCLKIRDKAGRVVPFVMNQAQTIVDNALNRQLNDTGKVRALILKGRQQGISTYVAARYYRNTSLNRGKRTFILTHLSDATNNLFNIVNRYHEHNIPFFKPQTTADNAKELEFSGLDSSYMVATAGSRSVGRSETIQHFHGCLAAGTLVVNGENDELTPIELFKVGDLVRTHTGKKANISFISRQEKECLEVRMRGINGLPFMATGEHRFITQDGWKELSDISERERIGFPVFKISKGVESLPFGCASVVRKQGGGKRENVPETIKINYNLGRVVGLYLAEGSLKKQYKHPHSLSAVYFTVHKKDVERTVFWLNELEDLFSSISVHHKKDSKAVNVAVNGKSFASFMSNFSGDKDSKRLPSGWENMGEDFVRGIVHGYLSGDGGSYADDRRIRATSIRSAITVGIRDAIASLGYGFAGVEYRSERKRNGRCERGAYTLSLCGEGVDRLAKEIGKPTLPRKRIGSYRGPMISDGFAWVEINSICKAGNKVVYDFEVDHTDHSYCILQGGSHNSEVAFWPNAADHFAGVVQAVSNEPGTEIILESTANGIGNKFHEMWQDAEKGESEYLAIFVPWFMQDEYRADVLDGVEFGKEDLEYKRLYELDDEQLAWRRIKISELGASLFKQEYPANPTEAFQNTGVESYIDPADVMRARKAPAIRRPRAPLVMGVDPAGRGKDWTVITFRHGATCIVQDRIKEPNSMAVVGVLARYLEGKGHKYGAPDMCFIDIGHNPGIYDRLVELGHKNIKPVNFGGGADDKDRYANKRAEMYGLANEWLRDPYDQASIPDCDLLHGDLCAPGRKNTSNGKLLLESKEDIKSRIKRSTDNGDSFILTFAGPAMVHKGNLPTHGNIRYNKPSAASYL